MKQQRLSLIDGLRGLSALAVALFHYSAFFIIFTDWQPVPDWKELLPGKAVLWPIMDYGLRAVELFWVISGFIFAHIYMSRTSTRTSEFFVARFARLYPLHFLTLICISLLMVWGYLRPEHFILPSNADAYHFLLQLFFASSWGFQNGESFNSVIWSVSVEIPIYAVFWLSRKLLLRHGSIIAIAMAAVFGFIVMLGPPTFIFACGFFFFSGAAIALLRQEIGDFVVKKALLGSALLILSVYGFGSGGAIGPIALGLNGAFCLLVFLAVEAEKYAAGWLQAIAGWLGDASYGIYLWHMPLILALKLSISYVTDVSVLALNGWFMAAYMVLILIIARLSFVWFEEPARIWLNKRLSRERDDGRGRCLREAPVQPPAAA